MHGSVFLRDLAWVLAASLPVIFLFRKLKAPSIAAFLVTGMLIGPHALGLVEDPARVSGIAELGVALILFFVGLEFPLARLKTMGRSALVGGSLQMAFAARRRPLPRSSPSASPRARRSSRASSSRSRRPPSSFRSSRRATSSAAPRASSSSASRSSRTSPSSRSSSFSPPSRRRATGRPAWDRS